MENIRYLAFFAKTLNTYKVLMITFYSDNSSAYNYTLDDIIFSLKIGLRLKHSRSHIENWNAT